MKKSLIISFFFLASFSGFSQTENPVNVTPAYTAPCPENPPCYMHKTNNHEVMECPGKNFNTDLNISSEGTYTGNYPTTNTKDVIPYLKNNGKAVWIRPAYDEPYTILQDPPCYIYKRHNLVVMECPGILFPPEK